MKDEDVVWLYKVKEWEELGDLGCRNGPTPSKGTRCGFCSSLKPKELRRSAMRKIIVCNQDKKEG